MDEHGDIIIYQTEVLFQNKLKNVFEEGELLPESNVQNLHVAHSDKPLDFYSFE